MDTPLAPGPHTLAMFTLAVAPRPGVFRLNLYADASQTKGDAWVGLQGLPLTVTVRAP